MRLLLFLAIAAGAVSNSHQIRQGPSSVWTHICRNSRCERILKADLIGQNGTSIEVCKLNCASEGSLFPLPTGTVWIDKSLTAFYPSKLTLSGFDLYPAPVWNLFNGFVDIFKGYLTKMSPEGFNPTTGPHENNSVVITLTVSDTNAITIKLDSDESYNLTISVDSDNKVYVLIDAVTYFGARYGLETLAQLIAFDEDNQAFQVVNNVTVRDKPAYRYRGVSLDTSRNFFTLPVLKRVVDGLSFDKMNILHWHITDTHSFPMEVKGRPQFTDYGAYSGSKVYTLEEMSELVQYALVRGVKVVPEFDEPAHTGFGWQWGPFEGLGNLAVCVNQDPWYDFCVEPPCGQLNVVNDNVYTLLGDIFTSMLEIFDNDLFHMGGDEVDFRCYNTTAEITNWMTSNNYTRDVAGFVRLWGRFQTMAHDKLVEASQDKDIQSILWTSELTNIEHVLEHLDPSKYIIQIWTSTDDQQIQELINAGYRTVFSNFDALYLDCGFHNWIGNGHNWCSPYKTWQQIYEHNPYAIYRDATNSTQADDAMADGRLLGAEAPLWTEQADELSAEGRIWPRTSALAERLWTNPMETVWEDAETRMVTNRQRLVQRGVRADRLQPEFCSIYQSKCYGYPTVEGNTSLGSRQL